MKVEIRKARRTASKARIGLAGPSGSGKTFTAIRVGMALAAASESTSKPGSGRVVFVDTERESADLYAGEHGPDGEMDFDVIPMPDHKVETFTAAIRAAAAAGYPVLVIDSFTHAWTTVLAWKDSMTGNSYTNWGKVTPVWDALVDAVLRYPGHVICCLRAKQEHVQVTNGNGRQEVQKLGMGAVVRDGMEYEFTLFADMEHGTNRLIVSKSRCSALAGSAWIKPGADFAKVLIDWLASAEAQAPAKTVDPQPEAATSGHHPEFTEIKKVFMANLGKRGVKYEDLAAWTEETEGQRPSAWDKERLRALLADMAEGKPGRVAMDEWLHERAERAAIQGEGA